MCKEKLKQVVDLQAEYYSTWDKKHSDKIANDLIRSHSDWLIEQTERVQGLEHENRVYSELLDMLVQQNKRYREVLEFYANENNYEIWNSMAVRGPEINRDKGYKARKALEGSK